MAISYPTETFGSLLKFLRRRAHLTQRDLAAAVGYTEAHICRLEKNERLPDLSTVAALFVPALDMQDDSASMERLLKLAAEARNERLPSGVKINQVRIEQNVERELGALEDVPPAPVQFVNRPEMYYHAHSVLKNERSLALCGMAGMGKTSLAASLARSYKAGPVFWHTFTEGLTTSVETILRQLALFFLANGQDQVQPLIEPRKESAPMPVDQQLMLIRAALMDRPALLCFEDVHLLMENETSLSLLRHLNVTTNASLLLTSRENIPFPIPQINVGGLEHEEARDLVRKLGLSLTPSEFDRLFGRTDGNPMLLRLAAGQLLAPIQNVEAFLEHLESQPQVSSYLLTAVLGDLSSSTNWLASFLSVFRQPVDLFDEALVESIESSGQLPDLSEAVSELQSHYFIEDTRRAVLHPLVRDFLYASLASDTRQRKRLHRLAAGWWESATENIVEAAYHWLRAGDLEQAAELICVRSEELFHRGQAKAAVDVVDEALARIERKRGNTTDMRRNLLAARGDLLRGTLRAADAEASYREALALAQNQPVVRAQIVRNLAQVMMQRGQTADALRLVQSALAGLFSGDTVILARLGAIEARGLLALSRYDEAERSATAAIRLVDQFAESLPSIADDVRARCERTLGWINYTRHPEGDESLAHYARALECARRSGMKVVECAILSNTATALLERGDQEGARKAYQAAFDGYHSLGDMYGEAGVLHNLGVLAASMEENDAALAEFEKASEIERRIGDIEGLLSSEGARSSLLLTLGKVEEARAVLERVLIDGHESTDLWSMGTCLCLNSEVLMVQGELEPARKNAERVLAMPGIEGNARIRAWAYSDLALVRLVCGETDEAQAMMAAEPSADLGFELTTRYQLVQSAVAIACHDLVRGHAIARRVIDESKQKGMKLLVTIGNALLVEPPPPLADLPRIVLIGK